MNAQDVIRQLQTLDVYNPGAWPAWVRYAAAVLLALILAAAGLWFVAKPLKEELDAARQQEKTLRSDFEAKQKKVAGLEAYREQLAEMEKSFGAMLKQLPSKAEVANLLNDVSQARIANSLEEELFQPQGEVPKDFYAEIPNKIVVVGDYHEMGGFVSAVASLPRIVTIEDVEIQPIVVKGSTKAATQLRMTGLAKTYRYLDDEEIAVQQKPAKGKGKKK